MEFKLVYNYWGKPITDNTKLEIKIECYHNRQYKHIGTGVFIESKYWDNSYLSKKCPQYKVVDALLQNKLNHYKNTALDYERSGKIYDFNALKHTIGDKDNFLFYQFIEDELKNEPELDLKTVMKYKSNIAHISGVLPSVAVSDISESDISKLDAYFRKEFAQSTTARMHVFVQKYIKIAIKKRLLTFNPYDNVKLNMDRGDAKIAYLTLAELSKLEELKNLPKNHQMVLDRFLYSCYTGLRISDNLALRKDCFTDTKDGYVVDLRTIKGYGHDLIHPIGLMFEGKPDKIARRWINAHDGDTLFPIVSTTYISEVLKVLAETAKITKHLNFHVSRHTCASLLADISQNPFLIKNILGHTDIKTSMIYIHASPESTKKQLRILDGKWNNAR